MRILITYPLCFIYRYDYLEFTDSRGGKVRYDMKVGTEKWPKVGFGNIFYCFHIKHLCWIIPFRISAVSFWSHRR